ncbi:MAG: response regulator [Anaerolineae bacterium]|nr:response regulator [Anaerolineae bacterium]
MPDVLIVDDEGLFRESISMALQLEGYGVRAVANGAGAIAAMQQHSPDLVILDLCMPDVSGWDVISQMRDHAALQHTPVVVLTASADESTRHRAQSERVQDLLIKPVGIEEILQAIRNAIPGH